MRQRQPFYKKSHACWYVQINGSQVRLDKDRDKAFAEYHRLMAGQTPATSKTTVEALVDQFLVWIQQNRAPATYDWYLNHCQSFIKHVGHRLKVSDVKPFHITQWLEKSHKKSGNTYKNGACRAVARAFNWAKKQGLIAASPIAEMERPAAKRRDAYLTLEQWQALIALVPPSDPFHDLLVFLWETGARPHEARMARADNFDKANRQIILDLEDSKGEKYQRFILLNDRAFEIVSRLATGGPIFKHGSVRPRRSASQIPDGKNPEAWAGRSLQCRLAKLSKKLGFKVIPYVIRHSWITHALLRGVDPLTVGILAGHRDATQVMRTYGHVAQDRKFLAAKLRQATGEDQAA